MIDIHLHLDGSMSVEDYVELALNYGVDLGKGFPNDIYVTNNCLSLAMYLTRFDKPVKLLQCKDAIRFAVKSLIYRLSFMGYIYAEIRFAPLLHTQKGMTQLEAAQGALEGLEEALRQCPDIEANLILCCMRHAPEEENMETIEVANKLKGTRVVAVDLAGGETLHPCNYFKNVFGRAKQYGLNITIHAGEATGSDEIMMALDNGAKRIGHGVHLSLDEESVRRVKERDVCFEFCPTSNLQTKSLKTYEDVPLRQFLRLGIPVTINSDNMTVSRTDAINELKIMRRTFNLSKDEVYTLLLNSIYYSFAKPETKRKLKEKLDQRIAGFYFNL